MGSILSHFNGEIRGVSTGFRLVFLHGLMGYAGNWRRVAKYFESKAEVLVFDQRGHGKSIKPIKGYASEDYAKDLYDLVESIGWSSFYLIGHSMGARNALMFTHIYPKFVLKLVMEDLGPGPHPEGAKKLEHLILGIPTPFKGKQEAKEYFLNKFENPVLGAYLQSNLQETSHGEWDWRFYKEGILHTLKEGHKCSRWSEYKQVKCPLLVMRGEKSEDLNQTDYQRMLIENPFARGVEIPRAGHWVHFDQPDLFCQALDSFLFGD